MRSLLAKIKTDIPACHPPLWASSGHLQTIMGHILPSKSLSVPGEKFNITVDDNDDLIHSTYLKGHRDVVVYLFHGLGGSADASYMQRTAIVAQELGFHVFLNNHRGCGQGVGLAKSPYHSGRADDLSSVIAFGRKMLPELKHIAIGFSLSANALLLLASGHKGKVLPDGAIAVNGPINLDEATVKLTQGLNRVYDKNFVKELSRYVKSNNPQALTLLKGVRTLRDFDEALTAPLGGFKNRQNYYETCSAFHYLSDIRIPTVLLTAADDPFVNVEDYLKAKISSSTLLHVEARGGHMGYLHKDGIGFERWLDGAIRSYLMGLQQI